MTSTTQLHNVADLKLESLKSESFTNPMIDADGDTYKVSSALNFLSKALADFEEETPFNDKAVPFGLAVILDTCAAALRRMAEKQL